MIPVVTVVLRRSRTAQELFSSCLHTFYSYKFQATVQWCQGFGNFEPPPEDADGRASAVIHRDMYIHIYIYIATYRGVMRQINR